MFFWAICMLTQSFDYSYTNRMLVTITCISNGNKQSSISCSKEEENNSTWRPWNYLLVFHKHQQGRFSHNIINPWTPKFPVLYAILSHWLPCHLPGFTFILLKAKLGGIIALVTASPIISVIRFMGTQELVSVSTKVEIGPDFRV